MSQKETIAVVVTLCVVLGGMYFSGFVSQSPVSHALIEERVVIDGLNEVLIVVPGMHVEVPLTEGRGFFERTSKPLEQGVVTLGDFVISKDDETLATFSVSSPRSETLHYLGLFGNTEGSFRHRWSLPLGENLTVVGVRIENGNLDDYTVAVDTLVTEKGKEVQKEVRALVKGKKFITE